MKLRSRIKTFFITFSILICLFIDEATAFSETDYMETHENIDQGIITLSSHNYSENNNGVLNTFLSQKSKEIIFVTDPHSAIYGALKPQILFIAPQRTGV